MSVFPVAAARCDWKVSSPHPSRVQENKSVPFFRFASVREPAYNCLPFVCPWVSHSATKLPVFPTFM